MPFAKPRRERLGVLSLLGVVAPCLTLVYLDGVGTTIVTLVIVAAELPPLFPFRRAVIIVAAQTLAVLAFAATQAPLGDAPSFNVALFAFQLFAFGGTFVAEPDFEGHVSDPLTTREVEILRLIAGGSSNREIADTLGTAEGTVKNHASSIMSKLGVRDRTRAVLKALELGLI